MPVARPVIGIPVNSMSMEGMPAPGLERAYVNQDYIRSVSRAGGVPLLLPVVPVADIQAQLDRVDALLLPGGPDLGPQAYGEQPSWGLGATYPEEDEHQLALARQALAVRMPVLAICRGMQIMNVARGGTLHQDLRCAPEGCLQHVQKGRRHVPSHPVTLAGGSRLAAIFQRVTLGVNSFHHQAIKDLAPGFRATAFAPDGIIEGIESDSGGPVLGVQWHPEAMSDRQPEMAGLFRSWIQEIAAASGVRSEPEPLRSITTGGVQ